MGVEFEVAQYLVMGMNPEEIGLGRQKLKEWVKHCMRESDGAVGWQQEERG